jgi:hypothetical protein
MNYASTYSYARTAISRYFIPPPLNLLNTPSIIFDLLAIDYTPPIT